MEKVTKGRAERSAKIDELRAMFEAHKGGILADYRGLDMNAISELREKLREHDITFHVVKNTLTKLAVKGSSYETLDQYLKGPTGIAFSEDDAIMAAKIAVEFSKENKAFEVKGGFMEGGVLGPDEIAELSKLGGKDQLLAQVLSVFNAPCQRMLGVINGVPQKFLGVLQAREDQIEQGA